MNDDKRAIGPQRDCVQCHIPKAEIRRKGYFCATVDYWGETETEWNRHKFMWTQRDVDALAAETAYWEEALARMDDRGDAS